MCIAVVCMFHVAGSWDMDLHAQMQATLAGSSGFAAAAGKFYEVPSVKAVYRQRDVQQHARIPAQERYTLGMEPCRAATVHSPCTVGFN